jgi:hypothetical protein
MHKELEDLQFVYYSLGSDSRVSLPSFGCMALNHSRSVELLGFAHTNLGGFQLVSEKP